ncbi:hypothetical protein Dsin_002476 [Dipteronia sinensis]|uniref:RNase H type-1 domain-containing protein n=1 Tax=Dipteronia sinensis TaxID=43782 RepID=A0AAE0B753_9ROSI|nr:hypothetical protein Dsin_002476 [Dipteronia sinensis]
MRERGPAHQPHVFADDSILFCRPQISAAPAFVVYSGPMSRDPGSKDDKGKVIIARSRQLDGSFSSDTGKLLALREGLLLAKFYNIDVKTAEVDSSFVASILNSQKPFLGDAKFIVNDIKALFLAFGICKCQATLKSGNSLALNLAMLAFSSSREQIWLDSSPLVVLFLVF